MTFLTTLVIGVVTVLVLKMTYEIVKIQTDIHQMRQNLDLRVGSIDSKQPELFTPEDLKQP